VGVVDHHLCRIQFGLWALVGARTKSVIYGRGAELEEKLSVRQPSWAAIRPSSAISASAMAA
jgi:hypothetical protein